MFFAFALSLQSNLICITSNCIWVLASYLIHMQLSISMLLSISIQLPISILLSIPMMLPMYMLLPMLLSYPCYYVYRCYLYRRCYLYLRCSLYLCWKHRDNSESQNFFFFGRCFLVNVVVVIGRFSIDVTRTIEIERKRCRKIWTVSK